jgi:hypothetical protein
LKTVGLDNAQRRKISMRGEKIYEYDLDITGVTDHGVSLQSIMSGEQKVPPQATAFDASFEGPERGDCGASTMSECARMAG